MSYYMVWVNGEFAPDIKAESLKEAGELAGKKYQDKLVRVEPCLVVR